MIPRQTVLSRHQRDLLKSRFDLGLELCDLNLLNLAIMVSVSLIADFRPRPKKARPRFSARVRFSLNLELLAKLLNDVVIL